MKKLIKLIISLQIVSIIIMNSNVFSAVVSDNDGSAFISKAEFDSLKNNFQSALDGYNSRIDSKIDSAISSYLAGIRAEKTENCSLMFDAFRFPLQILDENPTYIENHINNNTLIYQPKESYLVSIASLNDSNSHGGEYPLIHIYKFNVQQDKNGRSNNEMYNISYYDTNYGLINGMYDDFETEISYNIPIGEMHTFVDSNGRGMAIAFDENAYTGNGSYHLKNHTRQALVNNYTTNFIPSEYNKQSNKVFNYRMYTSYMMSNRNDTYIFRSIDDWWGGSDTYSLLSYKALSNVYKHLVDVAENSSSIMNSKINIIQNNTNTMLPVVYDGKIKLMNHKNWRKMARLNRNASTYNFTTFRSESGKTENPYQSNGYKTGVNPNYTAELWTIATAGWGVTAEDKNTTLNWYDNSLVKTSRLYYQVRDNQDSDKLINVSMDGGMPLWHCGNKEGDAEITITLNSFDTTLVTPRLYIAKNEMIGTDHNYFGNLYKLSWDKTTYYDYVFLNPGENKVHIKDIKKDDVMYFKILHGSNQDIIISEIPTMQFTSND